MRKYLRPESPSARPRRKDSQITHTAAATSVHLRREDKCLVLARQKRQGDKRGRREASANAPTA
jgi:hypothetical protein